MRVSFIAVALSLSLVVAAPAAAATDQSPVRLWSVSKVAQGTGEASVRQGTQVGGTLRETVEIGRLVFNLPLHAPYWASCRATGRSAACSRAPTARSTR